MRPLRRALAIVLAVSVALIVQPALQAKDNRRIDAADAAHSSKDEDFGTSLAWAARWQTWIPVIYNPSYTDIPYPNGDVAWYYGVCTDVLVRAYRWLGVDLQVEVKRAHVGSGDTNIDHRRVEVLRKFFARKGQSLPITDDPADYKPGDIVSYYVPTGHFSKTHIAIVSDRKATGGAPLIIHNRGFGVQEENRLFAEKITGHYRYWPKGAASPAAAEN
jgi:uncharacterized protein YijF (DUF1287 family)